MKSVNLIRLILAVLLILNRGETVQAAEKVVLIYSVFRKPIAVSELRHLADTGEASSTLKPYLKLANKEPESLQSALNQRIEVDQLIFPRFINSFMGNFLLDQISEILHGGSPSQNREFLRQALLKSSARDNDIKVIEILEHYPHRTVYVEGERLLEVYTQIRGVVDKLPGVSR